MYPRDYKGVKLEPTFNSPCPPAKDDPTLYRPEHYDLTLTPGFRAIDAGTVLPGVTDGFTAKAPDLGALEWGRAVPAYGPRPGPSQP